MKKKKDLKWFFAFGKPWLKKWWLWVIIGTIVLSIPLIINYLYLKGANYETPNTSYSSSDLLVFYGTVLGASATIIAVVLTIISTNRNSTSEQKLQTKRILASIRENELRNQHSDFKAYCEKIKSVIMMEKLEKSNIFSFLTINNKICEYIEGLNEVNAYFRNLNISDIKEEIEFREKTVSILLKISKDFLLPFSNETRNANNQDDQEIESEHKSNRRINKLEQIKVRGSTATKQTKRYSKSILTESTKEIEIWSKYEKMLFDYRNEYKDEYNAIYKKYIDYKEQVLIENVKCLYSLEED